VTTAGRGGLPGRTVLDHATRVVSTVVQQVWPGEVVSIGPQLPSVTNYVTAVTVREGWFVAKYSILGTSLLSILRGACGPWDRVEAAQRDYVQQPTAQLARERSQLRALAAHARRTEGSLRVPAVIAYQDGVLISTASSGSSLAGELVRGRIAPDRLLTDVIAIATALHRDQFLARELSGSPALATPHTSITATFARKFTGVEASCYLDSLGAGWLGGSARTQLATSFRVLREILHPLLRRLPAPVVIYGDLKPEHVLLDTCGRQTWIDPGLQRGDPAAELAKLLSRVALLLITSRPSLARMDAVGAAMDLLVTSFVARHPRPDGITALRRLLVLLLADWANYLASGLSVPPDVTLPLPPMLLEATGQAQSLLRLAGEAAASLTIDPARAWGTVLAGTLDLATGQPG